MQSQALSKHKDTTMKKINLRKAPLALAIAAFGFGATSSALAFNFETEGGVKGSFDSTVSFGVQRRMKSPDNSIIGRDSGGSANTSAPLGSLVNGPGFDATANPDFNYAQADDGNLNYLKGDLISAPLIYTSELELRYMRKYGVYGRAQAWYDYAGENQNVPHGSIANGYEPDQKLNDSDYYSYNKFSGFRMQDYFAYGNWEVDTSRLTARLGQQSINGGESLL